MLDDRIAIRISSEDKELFEFKCSEIEIEYQDFLRKMIKAFNNNRLTIKPKGKTK